MSGTRGRYLRNTSWMMASRVFRLGAAFLISVLTARYLGKGEFGELNYLLSFVMLFGALGTLGLGDILVRELEASPADEDEILGTALLLRLGGTLLMTAAALGMAACLGRGWVVVGLMVPVCAFQLLQNQGRTFERRFEAGVQAKWSSIAQTLAILASLGTSVGLILARASMPAFLMVKVLESGVLLAALAAFHRRIGGARAFRFSKARAGALLRAGLPLMLTGTFLLIYMRIDQVMIRHFLDKEAVGCYAAAVRLSEAWYFVPSVIAASFFPAILLARREDPVRYRRQLQALYELMTWLGIVVAVPVTLCSGWIVRLLFGAEYAPAGPVLALYVWAGVFVFQAVVRGKWIVAESLQRYALVFTALATTVNVVLNAILIPRVGLTGAALATVISCACQSVLVPALFAPTRPSAVAILRSLLPVHLLREGTGLYRALRRR
ncbi:MAG: flippase [Victivallales bacterium]|nr:flippase [Victivallales bacterium]